MNDVWRALGTSAAILLPVVILIIGVTMVIVKRGEAGLLGLGHHGPDELVPATASAPAKTAKAAGPVIDEISVPLILLLGLGLFTLTVLALLGLSLLQHAN